MKKGRDNKPHIGIFGRRNTGKSSFINALVGQEIAIVSEQAGTTTDPVKKSIEIFGIGPAIIIDTAGIDDVGELGRKRVEKSIEALKVVDCAVLMIAENHFDKFEINLINSFSEYEIPFIIVHNKADLQPIASLTEEWIRKSTDAPIIDFSSVNPTSLDKVIDAIRKAIPPSVFQKQTILGDLINRGDYVLLITPIDNEAPDGRMILPQVMAIRDVLDHDGINIVLKEDQVEAFFKSGAITPKLAVTDSQVFSKMKDIVPESVPFTSFSILFARLRGDFQAYMEGTPRLDQLEDGDRLLILESCTHQVNCDDIGRNKLPNWLLNYSDRKLEFDVVAGLDRVSRDMGDYKLVIQCGGCMVTHRQLRNRLKPAKDAEVPVSNYGLTIAWINGIYDRVIEPFKKNYVSQD